MYCSLWLLVLAVLDWVLSLFISLSQLHHLAMHAIDSNPY